MDYLHTKVLADYDKTEKMSVTNVSGLLRLRYGGWEDARPSQG